MSIFQLLRAINNSTMPAHNTGTPPVAVEALFVDDPTLRLRINGHLVGVLVRKRGQEEIAGLEPDPQAPYGLVQGVMNIIDGETP